METLKLSKEIAETVSVHFPEWESMGWPPKYVTTFHDEADMVRFKLTLYLN